jgi:hypothetical protein
MSKTRRIAGTVADPTLPKTPVEVGGKTYNLCFDLGALAEAETAINAELAKTGRIVNLLAAFSVHTLATTRIMFAAAVRTFHPEFSFEQALALPKLTDMYRIGAAVVKAYTEAMVEPEEANPPQPGE